MANDVSFDVLEQLAILNDERVWRTTKELNIISWDGQPPVFDLRKWKNGEPLKGLTMTEPEAYELMTTLIHFFRRNRTLPKSNTHLND